MNIAIKNKAVLILTIAVMMVTCVLLSLSTPITADAASKFHATAHHGNGHTYCYFKFKGMKGLCCEAGKYCSTSGKAHISKEYSRSSTQAHLAYWYGYHKGWTSGKNGLYLARTFSYVNGHGTHGQVSKKKCKELIAEANKHDVPTSFHTYLCKPDSGSNQDFIVWKKDANGSAYVVKTSSNTSISKSGNYSLAGIQFTLYKGGKTNAVATLTTDKNGKTNTVSVESGDTYWVKETYVPPNCGFIKNENWYSKYVEPNKTAAFTISNAPGTGDVDLTKKITGDDGGTPSGFHFIVKNSAGKKVGELVSTANGTSNKITGLPYGTYTVTEDLTDEQMTDGYEDITNSKTVTLNSTNPHGHVEWTNKYTHHARIIIIKKTKDGGSPKDFEFNIARVVSNSKTITQQTILNTANATVDEKSVEWEITNPDVIAEINKAAKDSVQDTYEIHLKASVPNIPEQSGDVGGDVIGGDSGGGDSGDGEGTDPDVPEITYDEVTVTVKVKLIDAKKTATVTPQETTDANSHVIKWNDFDFAGSASAENWNAKTGASGKYVLDDVDPGHYVVTEIMTDKQKSRYYQPQKQEVDVAVDSIETFSFTFTNEPKLVPVKLKKTSPDGNIENIQFVLTGRADYADADIEPITKTTDKDGKIDFGQLYPGKYKVEETGFDDSKYINAYPKGDNKNPIIEFTITDEDAQWYKDEGKAADASLWIGGPESNGTVSREPIDFVNIPMIDFIMTKTDGLTKSFLPGATFELKKSDGTLVVKFKINEDEQGNAAFEFLDGDESITGTVYMATSDKEQIEEVVVSNDENSDTAGGNQLNGQIEEDATTPSEENAGKNTGEEGTDVNDDNIENEQRYLAIHGLRVGEIYVLTETDAPDVFSPIDRNFIFSLSYDDNHNRVLSIYENTENDEPIIEPILNGAITVENYVPSIGTTARDTETNDHISLADDKSTIIDLCEFENLTTGQTYTIVGYLMDRTTFLKNSDSDSVKNVKVNGEKVVGMKTFKAESSKGVVEVPIELDASALAGRNTVIYEYLYVGEVAEGEEPKDENFAAADATPNNDSESIDFPSIGTTAIDKETEKQISMADEDVTIVDTVEYKNLTPGKEYKLTGVLMDKATGKEVVVDGKTVTAETVFTPKEANGTETVEFNFNGSDVAGKTLVVFESVTLDGADVAKHEDINDEGQTIVVPKIGTKAEDAADGDNEISYEKNQGVIDTIAYENLIPGKQYKIKGTMIDKSNKKEISSAGKTFTPEESSGKVTVEFTVDGSNLGGHELVAYEELYLDDDIVAEHKDINDKSQTVSVAKNPKEKVPQTGQSIPWILLALGLLMVSAGVYLVRQRKTTK